MRNKELPQWYKLSTKDIAELSLVSIRTAERIKAEIKHLFNIKIVRYKHYLQYYENF